MVGPEKDETYKRCRMEVDKFDLPVTFTGLLSKEEWIKASRGYDIFINTTNVDNTPISLIEALALGLPVITTNVGGIPYLIENNVTGILVEPNDAKAFTEAIIHLLEHPYLATSISTKARAKVEEFDWHKVKASWLSLINL